MKAMPFHTKREQNYKPKVFINCTVMLIRPLNLAETTAAHDKQFEVELNEEIIAHIILVVAG